MSGFIVHAFGFSSMLYFISFLGLCYAPLMILLRNPPGKDEKMVEIFLFLSEIFLFFFFLVINHERKS